MFMWGRLKRCCVLLILLVSVGCVSKPVSAASYIKALNASQQKIAKAIVRQIQLNSKKVYRTPKISYKDAYAINRAINHDYFWYGYNPVYLATEESDSVAKRQKTRYVVSPHVSYESYLINRQLGAMANTIVKSCVRPGMTPIQKVEAINLYMCKHFRYYSTDQAHHLADLKKWRGNCGSYSFVFKAACIRAGVRCREITGTINGSAHAWNGVKFGKQWYHIDVCWNAGGYENGYGAKTYWLSKRPWRDHTYLYHEESMLAQIPFLAYYTKDWFYK